MQPYALQELDRFLRYMEIERRASPHTLDAYGRDLTAFRSHCALEGIKTWAQLQAAHVRGFAARAHREGLSPRSVARQLSTVRTFLAFAVREGVIKSNPAEGVTSPKIRTRLPSYLTVEETEQILAVQGDDDDPLTSRDRAIVELFYSSALRLAELVGLDCQDIDFSDGVARVLGKGQVTRIVPVGAKALAAVKSWLEVRAKMTAKKQEALFVGRNGRRLSPRNIQVRTAEWAQRQGIRKHVHPHMFRHASATHLLEAAAGKTGGDAASLRDVQEFLGHKVISTTAIYTHLAMPTLTKAYRAAHPRASMDIPDIAKASERKAND